MVFVSTTIGDNVGASVIVGARVGDSEITGAAVGACVGSIDSRTKLG
jgi:hypothetical protein